MPSRDARDDREVGDAWTHSATAVATAEPAMPRRRPRTSSTASTALTATASTVTTSVVRVSCSPRSTPIPAIATSAAGKPIDTTCR